MKRVTLIFALVAAAALWLHLPGGAAMAQSGCVRLLDGSTACPPADSKCVQDRYSAWFCSAPGGDARLDLNGNPACGNGACVVDINGLLQCSTESRGAAAMDITSKAVCTGGCAPANANLCRKLTR